ncbi:putative lipid II flippase FtsW [Paramagnetospirillum kuznetsovii]|uniref:Probable peptidoglycan glycosyltransferase FtsW n=1 Tax=Paramagnetospirillum kuznetsovii TaxID=2053833 RepID=A0A364P0Q8_9PROT|nr:putative lipid II flippase FtsW [Paramagnetospirillum kuznetsovii]RAU22911.1 putative lipid II flippase FtsW [Paramagnetospirillum kuznetsovii]
MTITFGRTDTSTLGRWWWTVDRWSIAALVLLVAVGALLTMAASPAVAERINVQSFHFVRRQFMFLAPALITMVAVSLLSPKQIRRMAVIGLIGTIVLLALVPVLGAEVKGAKRWLNLGGLSIQPSEFVKPMFAVVSGWMFASARIEEGFPGRLIATGLFGVVAALLLVQPDVGQTAILTAIWAVQFFLAGLSIGWVVGLGLAAPVGAMAAYYAFPHVHARIDKFMDPSGAGGYQVTTALNAFKNGGLFGKGPGEGRVKLSLPDAHTDFILAVGGEEFGIVLCLFILALFAFIVLRGFSRVLKEDNLFVVLSTAGLLVQFGLQAMVNMASTLRMMPAKGMTLPFISYGGSSMVALALGMGMVLALTRTRYGREGHDA